MDSYSGFIMLDKNGNPKVALHIENEMRWAVKKYKKLHSDSPLPHIPPHVCRHTYTHLGLEAAQNEMVRLEELNRAKEEVVKAVGELSTAYKRPQTMKGGHEWWKYVYDEYYDCVICPEYQPLRYSTTNRDGYREYKSDPKICANCPTRQLCTHSKACVKTVQRHIWKDYEELADDARYTPEYRDLYARRKETIERIFADAKEKHAMRYTQYRGLAQVTKWVRLKFAAMNLKKLAKWKWKARSSCLLSFLFLNIYTETRLPLSPQPGFSTG